MLLDEIREDNRSVCLAGDARCCSPGHTAKFGSYNLLDLDTGKILDFKLVQVCPIKKKFYSQAISKGYMYMYIGTTGMFFNFVCQKLQRDKPTWHVHIVHYIHVYF